MRPTFLANLQKGREKVSICVRIVRKWIYKETTGQGLPLYVGLVLADAKGDAMYGEIPEEAMAAKEPLINIGKVYIISKFKVNNAKPSYRPVEGNLMVEFTEFTAIEIAKKPPETIPLLIYHLTPFHKIQPAERLVIKLSDVLGYVTKYGPVTSFTPKGKENVAILREVFIKDLNDNELKVTLWGDQAISFKIDEVYDETVGNVILLLFVGCIPRAMFTDPGKVYLSGSSGCFYYINPDIKEAQPFYSRFQNQQVFIDRPPPAQNETFIDIAPNILEHKTIAELNSIDPYDFADAGYKCTVAVTYIPQHATWWYMACRGCKKKAEPMTEGGHECPKCHRRDAIPRYILTFFAKDSTGEASFFAYDEAAQAIIQKSCEEVLNPLKYTAGVPAQVEAIIGKRFTFSVGLTENSFTSRAKRQYLINSILDRSDKKGSMLNAPPHSDLPQTNISPAPDTSVRSISTVTPQTTPTDSSHLEDTASKNIKGGPPEIEKHARRRLLYQIPSDDEEISGDTAHQFQEAAKESQNPSQDSFLTNDDALPPYTAQQMSKRLRSAKGNTSAGQTSAQSTPPTIKKTGT